MFSFTTDLPCITLPAAFLTQTVPLDDATVKFEIWDTAGTFIRVCGHCHCQYMQLNGVILRRTKCLSM